MAAEALVILSTLQKKKKEEKKIAVRSGKQKKITLKPWEKIVLM